MGTPRLWADASGHAFKEWKGGFYPDKFQPEAMLAWYAERLPTVEINNSFYQTPKVEVLQRWALVTPQAFRFAIKAPRRITHDARLAADAAADSVAYLYKNLATLGAKRGPVLFQLPPFLKVDLRLRLENYSEADLASWASRLAATRWEEVHVYFMHEPTAPGYAAALLALAAAAPAS